MHPEDERYQALIGKNVILPLVNRPVPVIADAAVLREFGTGAVKVTPAHDATDYEIGQRHGLPMPTVIDYDGRMIAPVWRVEPDAAVRAQFNVGHEALAKYVGMDRFAARKVLVADLEAAGALERVEPYETTVPVSSRSGEIIEPLLSLQWFMAMESLAKPALDAYRNGEVRFVPERFGRTYEHGLENLRDWNISRQVWWGHQLPVWYTPDGDAIVAHDAEEARELGREKYGTIELRRDPDTLDTWFSSGLWPFTILGWPAETKELEAWYPNQVMITGREIIFLWVTRMMMLGLRCVGRLPFRTVFITPLVFDLQGRKMSKSLGNAIDPLDLVEKYGADGFRFGMLRQMRLESQELRFDEEKCDEARRFNNKLWNALRFIASLEEGLPAEIALPEPDQLTLADAWILAKLRHTVVAVTQALDNFEMGVAADVLVQFGWYTFCDWYLESAKADSQRATRAPRAHLRARYVRAPDAPDRAVRDRRDRLGAASRRSIRRRFGVAGCGRDSARWCVRSGLRSFHDRGGTAPQRALGTRHRAQSESRRHRTRTGSRRGRATAALSGRRFPRRQRDPGRDVRAAPRALRAHRRGDAFQPLAERADRGPRGFPQRQV